LPRLRNNFANSFSNYIYIDKACDRFCDEFNALQLSELQFVEAHLGFDGSAPNREP
jgi:hypothetical protein